MTLAPASDRRRGQPSCNQDFTGPRSTLGAACPRTGSRRYARQPLAPTFITSRARQSCRVAAGVRYISRGRVHADQVRERLPWLYRAYRDQFLDLAREVSPEPVTAACDERYGIVLNVQRGTTMRFECHVDSNPMTGLLFSSDHSDEGELVVAQRRHSGGRSRGRA